MAMTYWYISIVNVAEVSKNGGKPVSVPLGFYGALFIEVDPDGAFEYAFPDAPELCVVEVAQKRHKKIPRNCQCKVLQISEMPPARFCNRILSREDLDALDKLDARTPAHKAMDAASAVASEIVKGLETEPNPRTVQAIRDAIGPMPTEAELRMSLLGSALDDKKKSP
jgi:hypothetical protein